MAIASGGRRYSSRIADVNPYGVSEGSVSDFLSLFQDTLPIHGRLLYITQRTCRSGKYFSSSCRLVRDLSLFFSPMAPFLSLPHRDL